MKKYWIYCSLIFALIGQWKTLVAQHDETVRSNSIKIDALWLPTLVVPIGKAYESRLSVEFTHFIIPAKLSAGFDVEFVRYDEYFQGFFTILPGTIYEYRLWSDGVVDTKQFSAILDARYRKLLLDGQRRSLATFIEPRLAISSLRGHRTISAIDSYGSDLELKETFVAPHVVTGMEYRMGRHLSLELFGEFFVRKFMGRGNHSWKITPGINLCFNF